MYYVRNTFDTKKLIAASMNTRSTRHISSNAIRKIFLDYFVDEHSHKFIRSSPVVPYFDKTIAFVNAGMNQFKNVFLGTEEKPCNAAVNHQKCVRVGGKHNDLSVVGTDGYHHTFFEMLGNWSFNSYGKKEACQLAWDLLLGKFKIDRNRIYVTYFAGDSRFGLKPDYECKDIWISLGVPEDRLLPFGMNENFWEMGATGPCGPCTEIHIDHLSNGNKVNRAKLVNSDDPTLTELWNIVFIENNRLSLNSIDNLSAKFIDTGMGFERLVKILQNVDSNYDTDLFVPIINHISELTGKRRYSGCYDLKNPSYSLDTNYRILADHIRMITMCLADGMFPDQNHKLRRVLRKSLLLAETEFGRMNLVKHTVPIVVDTLGAAYPEIGRQLSNIEKVIDHEESTIIELRQQTSKQVKDVLASSVNYDLLDFIDAPGFLNAYQDIQKLKTSGHNNIGSIDFLFKLYDTYGLNDELIEKLLINESIPFKQEDLQYCFKSLKTQKANQTSQLPKNTLAEKTILSQGSFKTYPATNDTFKYSYTFDDTVQKYKIPSIKATVLDVIDSRIIKDGVKLYSVVLDKTNFYGTSGGQLGDRGILKSIGNKNEFIVYDTQSEGKVIYHLGRFSHNEQFAIGDTVTTNIDDLNRTQCMLHHTATHLINSSIRKLFDESIVYQKSSSVNADLLKFEFGILNKKLVPSDIQLIEDLIRKIIYSNNNVAVKLIKHSDLYDMNDVILVPGEVYPEEGLRLISINANEFDFESKELCCGTHVHNTKHLGNFTITNMKQSGKGSYIIEAVAGTIADEAVNKGNEFEMALLKLKDNIQDNQETSKAKEDIRKIISKFSQSNIMIPYTSKIRGNEIIKEVDQAIGSREKYNLKHLVERDITELLDRNINAAFITHKIINTLSTEAIPLVKFTKMCPDRPILILSYQGGILSGRCCVPKDYITSSFNAHSWMKSVLSILEGKVEAPKFQDINEICLLKSRKIKLKEPNITLEKAQETSNKFANDHLQPNYIKDSIL